MAKRAGVPFDLELLRADPARFAAQVADARRALGPRQPLSAVSAGHPIRVQLSRAPGFRLPPNTVSVAAPTRWANPFRPAARSQEANAAAVEHFRDYLARNPELVAGGRSVLAGMNLACWCRPWLPCHADVWLSTANPVLLQATP